jgi:hypothetical protein
MNGKIIRNTNPDDFGFILFERGVENRKILRGRCFYSPPYVVSDFQAGLPELVGDGKECYEYYLYEQNIKLGYNETGVSALEFMEHFGIDPDDTYSVDHCKKETVIR